MEYENKCGLVWRVISTLCTVKCQHGMRTHSSLKLVSTSSLGTEDRRRRHGKSVTPLVFAHATVDLTREIAYFCDSDVHVTVEVVIDGS